MSLARFRNHAAPPHVACFPQSGLMSDIVRGRRWAKPRHREAYSTTSSASTSRLCGIARPSALAVLRLIASSYSVGPLDWKIAGLGAFEYLIHEGGLAAHHLGNVWTVRGRFERIE